MQMKTLHSYIHLIVLLISQILQPATNILVTEICEPCLHIGLYIIVIKMNLLVVLYFVLYYILYGIVYQHCVKYVTIISELCSYSSRVAL